MFFVLSKTISFLAKPIGILFVLGLLSICVKNHTKKKRLRIAFLVILYVFSCPAIINFIVKSYESPTQTLAKTSNYTFGVVLTGGLINESKSIENSIYLGPQADRLWQTVELYKAKKIKKIIISGGDGFGRIQQNLLTENNKARDFLIKTGIPASDIIQENKAVNTYENAKFTKEILKNHSDKILVITSGFHLRRALACFEKQHVKADGFACSPVSNNYSFKWQDLFPSMNAFEDADTVANEVVGIIIYKTLAYI